MSDGAVKFDVAIFDRIVRLPAMQDIHDIFSGKKTLGKRTMGKAALATRYMTAHEAADYLHLSYDWLREMRIAGKGPKYYRPKGSRRVFYLREDLDSWRHDQ